MKKIILLMVMVGVMGASNMAWAVEDVRGNFSNPDVRGNFSNPDVRGNNTTTTTSTQGSVISVSSKLENPLKAESIREVIFLIVDLAIWLGTAFAILAIIFVGFKFIYAQGKPEEIKEAKMWFMYIIIGLAILISSKVIVVIIQNTLTDSGVVNSSAFGK